jgi:23S rRNA (uracil1939-C5)-methyltransferase
MLRHSVARDQWLVNLITSDEAIEVIRPMAEKLMDAHPEIVAVVNNVTGRKAAIAMGEYEVPVAGLSRLKDRIGPFEFAISANSFFQTNTRSAALLYGKVKEFTRLAGTEFVLDLYSGTGTIAIFLADAAREVVGMEIVASAVQDAEDNCRSNHIENCRFVQGDVRERLAALEASPDVMILDPPRDGMHKDVLKQVIQIAPPRIVYVSCNPATLARDISLLKDHYHIAEVQPVDMFPHTWHIESVARLEKLPH